MMFEEGESRKAELRVREPQVGGMGGGQWKQLEEEVEGWGRRTSEQKWQGEEEGKREEMGRQLLRKRRGEEGGQDEKQRRRRVGSGWEGAALHPAPAHTEH